jgi:hypothetical protein
MKINPKLKEFLNRRDKEGSLNFNGLYKIIKNNNLDVNVVNINGAAGFCDGKSVFIDLDNLEGKNDSDSFFIIAHELSHLMRFKKKGSDYAINVYKVPTFEEYTKLGFFEEKFADKLACLIYFQLNKKIYHNRRPDYVIKQAIDSTRFIYDMINSSKITYEELLSQFISK